MIWVYDRDGSLPHEIAALETDGAMQNEVVTPADEGTPLGETAGSGSSRCGEAFRYRCNSPALHEVAFALFCDHLGRRDRLASLRGSGGPRLVRGDVERTRPAGSRRENGLQRLPTDAPPRRRYPPSSAWSRRSATTPLRQ